MTRALVVHESLFGNTSSLARAVAEGLGPPESVRVVAAADAPAELGADVELLVVGAPNHLLTLPGPSSRSSAAQRYGVAVAEPDLGLREWLHLVGVHRRGLPAAVFDVRSNKHPLVVRLDHASRLEERLLRRLGARLVSPAQHFAVRDVRGPLVDGEEVRAREWGRELAQLVAQRSART